MDNKFSDSVPDFSKLNVDELKTQVEQDEIKDTKDKELISEFKDVFKQELQAAERVMEVHEYLRACDKQLKELRTLPTVLADLKLSLASLHINKLNSPEMLNKLRGSYTQIGEILTMQCGQLRELLQAAETLGQACIREGHDGVK